MDARRSITSKQRSDVENPRAQFGTFTQSSDQWLTNPAEFSDARIDTDIVGEERRSEVMLTTGGESQASLITCPMRDQIAQEENEVASFLPDFLCSGRLFMCVAVVFGVWKPLGRCVLCPLLFALPLVLLSLGGGTIVSFACQPSSRIFNKTFCQTTRGVTITYHGSQSDSEMYEFLRFINMAGQVVSYIVMVYCVHRKQRGKRRPLDLPTACLLVKRGRWGIINLQLIGFFVLQTSAQMVRYCAKSQAICDVSVVTWNLVFSVAVWLGCLCCQVFAVVIYALEEVVDGCYDEIVNSRSGTLNEVIEIHQRVCSKISVSTHAYNKWFLFNSACYFWVIVYIAIIIITNRSSLNHWPDYYFICGEVLYAFFVLVYPWLTVARLSRKLDSVISQINATVDWGQDHVFWQRSQLSDFLQYASHARCEFARISFRSSLPWMSLSLGLIGLGIRIYS